MYFQYFDMLIFEFTVSGPHDFQMDSILFLKFQGPVDHMKKP